MKTYTEMLAAYTKQARKFDDLTLSIELREAWRPVVNGCSGPRHDAKIIAYQRIADERGIEAAPMN